MKKMEIKEDDIDEGLVIRIVEDFTRVKGGASEEEIHVAYNEIAAMRMAAALLRLWEAREMLVNGVDNGETTFVLAEHVKDGAK